MSTCSHLDQIRSVSPRTPEGCEECLKTGSYWVHLRLCLECGHVGCCDQSPGNTPPNISIAPAIPLCAPSSPVRVGAGAMLKMSYWMTWTNGSRIAVHGQLYKSMCRTIFPTTCPSSILRWAAATSLNEKTRTRSGRVFVPIAAFSFSNASCDIAPSNAETGWPLNCGLGSTPFGKEIGAFGFRCEKK
jgi:hypothetical protein